MNAKILDANQYQRNAEADEKNVQETVSQILADIMLNGDDAINNWSQKIDGQFPKIIKLKPFDDYNLDKPLADAISSAHKRIKGFCQFQMNDLKSNQFTDEIGDFGYKYQPIQRVGCYIPGGRFPLISTALMTITPANVAGCKVRIACSPSTHPALLAAASLAGATQFIQLGGAQAIGALSYGYADIKPVNMIVGPGNTYVNNAKSQVQHRTKIDTLAGPSELLVFANQLENPDWIILDALAQAEHDPNALSIILSSNKALLQDLISRTENSPQAKDLINNNQIQFVLSQDNNESINFINDFAPEHLMVCDDQINTDLLTNYGALFLGESSAVAFGDYCSGPNHTLPTSGSAKFSGGLSVHSFVKIQTIQKIKPSQRHKLSEISALMAHEEGLVFHKESVVIRG